MRDMRKIYSMKTQIYEATVIHHSGQFLIILPKEWVYKNGLKEGDKIGLLEFGLMELKKEAKIK
jgi:hypothetical protein